MSWYGTSVPIPLAPILAALLGVVFALVGRDEIRRSSAAPTGTRAFLIVSIVSFGLLAPAAFYFLVFYPDWAWAYLLPGSRVPSAVDLVAAIASAAVAPLAFVWTAAALRRHAVRELVRGTSVLVVLLAIASAFLGPRLSVAGTYTAYREGYDLQPASGTSLGVSILWIDACVIAGMLWAAARLSGGEPRRRDARVDSPASRR
jgi:hypothetical protein